MDSIRGHWSSRCSRSAGLMRTASTPSRRPIPRWPSRHASCRLATALTEDGLRGVRRPDRHSGLDRLLGRGRRRGQQGRHRGASRPWRPCIPRTLEPQSLVWPHSSTWAPGGWFSAPGTVQGRYRNLRKHKEVYLWPEKPNLLGFLNMVSIHKSLERSVFWAEVC